MKKAVQWGINTNHVCACVNGSITPGLMVDEKTSLPFMVIKFLWIEMTK